MLNKNHFPLPLRGEFVGYRKWKLFEPFVYICKDGTRIEVPVGFITDGGSIPPLLYAIIGSPWGGKYAWAAVPHDYLCTTKTFSRIRTQRIFLEGLNVLGVPLWKKPLMYSGVRAWSFLSWGKRAAIIILALSLCACASPKDYTITRTGNSVTVSGKKIWFGKFEEDGIGNVEIEAEITENTAKIKINNKTELFKLGDLNFSKQGL